MESRIRADLLFFFKGLFVNFSGKFRGDCGLHAIECSMISYISEYVSADF